MLVARGRLDRQGHLVRLDPPLARLHERAGGQPGGQVAIPEIAAVILQALSLSTRVARSIVVADGAETRRLAIEAKPEEDGVDLVVTGWETRLDLPDIANLTDVEFDRTRLQADGAWRTGPDFRITRMAAGLERKIGFLPATARGLPFSRVFRLVADMTGDMPILAALAAGQSFDDQPAELIPAKDAPILLFGVTEHNAQGDFVGLRGGFRFIAREAMPLAGDNDSELEHMVATRLEGALRAPIGRIIENADAVALQEEGVLRRDYARYGGDIAGAARHLLGLVDDLSHVQLIERSDFRIKTEAIELSDIARRASGLMGVRMIEKAIRVEFFPSDGKWMAEGDFGRALQILVNLISNAVRFSPQEGTIFIAMASDERRVCVSVRDQGKGIAAEDQARIFEKFERLDPSEPGGSGLGLYISRRLAQAMDGDVTVESAPGEGACFTLCLPVVRQAL